MLESEMKQCEFKYEITLPAAISETERLLLWIDGILVGIGCPARERSRVQVVCEEMFVNIARYAYAPNTGIAIVKANINAGTLTLRFEDKGMPFNPLEYKVPNLKVDPANLPAGGLGVYLMRAWAQKAEYVRMDGKNILTLHKPITCGPTGAP
jgi:anti-sigma regulatory factor (Ser/Thr protein kinase)